jgi:hypothetical protein
MTAQTETGTGHQIHLTAPAPQAVALAGAIAAATGTPAAEVAAALLRGPGPLCAGVPAGQLSARLSFLRALGLRVAAVAGGAAAEAATETRFDLAILPCDATAPRDIVALSALLSRLPGEVAADIARPGGLLLAGLAWDQVSRWRRRLDGLRGLRIALSDPAQATWDLLPWGRPAQPAAAAALLRHARLLGLGPCAMTGAAAAGLDLALRDHILRRFPGAGVIAVNRDFQRFDLVFVATPGLVLADFLDFLAPRSPLGRGEMLARATAGTLCIERGLSRADALCFQADYAVIGIETRARLIQDRRALVA